MMRRFKDSQLVLDVVAYVRWKYPDVGRDCDVAAQMPRKLLPMHESLQAAGVMNRETLTIEQKS